MENHKHISLAPLSIIYNLYLKINSPTLVVISMILRAHWGDIILSHWRFLRINPLQLLFLTCVLKFKSTAILREMKHFASKIASLSTTNVIIDQMTKFEFEEAINFVIHPWTWILRTRFETVARKVEPVRHCRDGIPPYITKCIIGGTSMERKAHLDEWCVWELGTLPFKLHLYYKRSQESTTYI